VTAASGSAGPDVLRHCDLNDLSRTIVERPSNRSRIVVVTTAEAVRRDNSHTSLPEDIPSVLKLTEKTAKTHIRKLGF